MANSYGGLILLGVTDQAQSNRLVGVPEATVVQIETPAMTSLSRRGNHRLSPWPLAVAQSMSWSSGLTTPESRDRSLSTAMLLYGCRAETRGLIVVAWRSYSAKHLHQDRQRDGW